MKLFVLTGSSRGMGAAIGEQLLADPAHALLGISRGSSESLAAAAAKSGATLEQWQADLAEPIGVAARLQGWLAGRDATAFTQATLINNAGVVTKIGALENCSVEELSAALRVGLEAPLLLTAAFLRATARWHGERRVLNISSGLGRRAMAGQATYCAAKAGMDNLSRAVALDQALVDNGAKIVSLAPGVIDTDMQSTVRAASAEDFADVERFRAMKAEGALRAAADVAADILRLESAGKLQGDAIQDLRQIA